MKPRVLLRRLRARALGLLIAAICTGALAKPPEPERVAFDSFDRDAAGQSVRLTALLYTPQRSGCVHGAVVALHGCGGIYGGGQRNGAPRAKMPRRG